MPKPPPNPYPHIPQWYWVQYWDEIYAFDAFAADVIKYGTSKGFQVRVLNRTPPQMGSAGTFYLEVYCYQTNRKQTVFVDDRLALSFGSDIARFYRWAFKTDSCVAPAEPIVIPKTPIQTETHDVQLGRYVPILRAQVCHRGLVILFPGG